MFDFLNFVFNNKYYFYFVSFFLCLAMWWSGPKVNTCGKITNRKTATRVPISKRRTYTTKQKSIKLNYFMHHNSIYINANLKIKFVFNIYWFCFFVILFLVQRPTSSDGSGQWRNWHNTRECRVVPKNSSW